MAQVQYAGGSGVPVLPSNIPGIPQGGYGDPGINPNTNQRATWWGGLFGGPVLRDSQIKVDPATGNATVVGGTTRTAAEEAATPGPFCLGGDLLICAGFNDNLKPLCKAITNGACLFVGLFILLAILGLGVKGILD